MFAAIKPPCALSLSLVKRFASTFSILPSVQPTYASQQGFRSYSSSTLRASTFALPSNLKLADPVVIQPIIKPKVVVEDYAFPVLDVPSTIAAKSFLHPGVLAECEPVALERRIFEVAIRKDIILTAIRYTRNARRQPKKTKRMSEIRGSNKKPRPQKGTGQSQVGHRRNSAWRGGQKAHGPVIRDYSINMNKKARALALMMALAAKFREGNLFVFDSLAPQVFTI
jgi:hypothetical protein